MKKVHSLIFIYNSYNNNYPDYMTSDVICYILKTNEMTKIMN